MQPSEKEAFRNGRAQEIQKLNEELAASQEKLQAALVAAEKASRAKTTFLSNMSHDIRTPMNVILGYAQLMKDELKENELSETSEHLEKLQQSGNLLLSIISNVLDMARIESGRMEIDENYIQVEDIWQDLFEVFDDEAKKKKIAFHLMDIQMPKMNGYKATQAIRRLPDKDKACIPIVAMTANAFEEDKRDAIAAGMDGHIAKPIQVDKLLSMLAEMIRQQETH